MKRFYAFSFLLVMILAIPNMMYADLDKKTTQTSAVDFADVCIDSNGNVYHMVFNGTSNQFIITKTDEYGELDDQFGTSGVLTLSIGNSSNGVSGTNINVNNFSSATSVVMRLDSNNKPVLGFMADRTLGNHVIIVVRLTATTGSFDTSFHGDGFAMTLMDSNTITTISDLVTDSTNRIIVCVRSSGGRPYILRHRVNAIISPTTIYIPLASLDDEVQGSKLVVDKSDNIYIVGKHGPSSGSYGMFCLKLNESDLSLNTSFATGSNNVYSTGNIGLDSNSTVFPVMIDTENANAHVRVFGLQAGGQSFAVYNVKLSDGTLKSFGSTSNVFPSSAVVKGLLSPTGTTTYAAGTINSGGETPFIARFTSNGSGDTTFITSGHENYIADGVAKIDITSGATFNSGDGGWLAYSATSPDASVVVGFKETSGGNLQFVRMFGLEDTTFLKNPAPIAPIAPSVSKTVVSAAAAGKARKDKSFSHIAISGTNIRSIDDGGVMVTGYDDVVSFFRDGSQFIFTVMTEQGGLEKDFTPTGAVKIALKASGGSAVNAVVTNFSQVTANRATYMASDAGGNIYIAVQVDITGGNKQIVVLKIKNGVAGTNGILDSTFGSGGAATLAANSDNEQLEGLLIDSQGRVIIVMHHDNTTNTTAQVYRLTSTGSADNTFALGKADLRTEIF